MATPWPEEQAWPTSFREHVAKLSRYLQAALKSVDNANGQLIGPISVRAAFIGALTLVIKLQNIPDLEYIHDAIANLHTETKTANEKATRVTNNLREELNKSIAHNTTKIKGQTDAVKAANNIAKEALEANKMTLKVMRDAKALGPMNPGSIAHTYASVVARGGLAASIHNPQNQRTSHVQTQREIIVNIRDPITIANLRSMSPRSLQAHALV